MFEHLIMDVVRANCRVRRFCDCFAEFIHGKESVICFVIVEIEFELPKAHRLIVRQFCARKSDGGMFYQMACRAVSAGSFDGVVIVQNQSSSRTDKLINRSQFYQALVDALNCRLMPASEQTLISMSLFSFLTLGLQLYRLSMGSRNSSKHTCTF